MRRASAVHLDSRQVNEEAVHKEVAVEELTLNTAVVTVGAPSATGELVRPFMTPGESGHVVAL